MTGQGLVCLTHSHGQGPSRYLCPSCYGRLCGKTNSKGALLGFPRSELQCLLMRRLALPAGSWGTQPAVGTVTATGAAAAVASCRASERRGGAVR